MSLQGTLETIPLPDVLALLAATKKTGELRITGVRGDGLLWLDAGLVVAADVARATTPVDAVFELLRLTTGSFTFGAGAPPRDPGEPIAVDAILAEARERLSAWKAIEAVVPSLACTLRLTPELGHDSVTVSRKQWKDLVAVAGGGDVSGTMKSLGIGEFEACRTVKELVDAGLVQVGKAPPAQPKAPAQPQPQLQATGEAPAPTPATAPSPAPEHGRPASSAPRSDQAAPSTERANPIEVRASVRRPVPARTAPASPAAAVATSGTATSAGRSPAPRPGPEAGRGREEAETLVQQLASLGRAQPEAAQASVAAGTRTDAASGKLDKAAKGGDEEARAQGIGDEPVNRGMLLKFLSSVRP